MTFFFFFFFFPFTAFVVRCSAICYCTTLFINFFFSRTFFYFIFFSVLPSFFTPVFTTTTTTPHCLFFPSRLSIKTAYTLPPFSTILIYIHSRHGAYT